MSEASASLPYLQQFHEEILRCGRCGFCQSACPVYRVTGREASVARGHFAHARALLEGQVDLNEDLQAALFECLLCKACTSQCFGALNTHQVLVAARHEYIRRHGLPASLRWLFRHLLPNPRRMARLLRAIRLGKRTRLADAADRLRVLRWVSAQAAAANRVFDTLPSQFLVDLVHSRHLGPDGAPRRVAYFMSCGHNFALPQVGQAALRTLLAANCRVEILQNNCCGLPAWAYGDLEGARLLARKNLKTLSSLDADLIVTDCGSCYSFLKSYPTLLSNDPDAIWLASKVHEFTQFALDAPPPSHSTPVSVTYHDPCHLSRYQDLRQAPREILRRTPGVHFTELPEADWCCGAAGTYNIFHYDQSMKILERKMANIRSTGAEVVVTSCPACIIQLRCGARLFNVPVRVAHLAQLISPAPSNP